MVRCLFIFFFLLKLPTINIKQEYEKASKLSYLEEIYALRNLLNKIKYDKDSTALVQFKLGNRYEIQIAKNPVFKDSALYFYNQSLQYLYISDKIKKASRASIKLGGFYRKNNEPVLAIKTLFKGFDFINLPNMSDYLTEITQIFMDSHNYQLNISALKLQRLILSISKENDPFTIYENLIKLSRQDTVSRQTASIKYLNETLNFIEKHKDLENKRLGTLNDLGIKYKELGDYKKAEFYYNKMKNDTLNTTSILYHNNLGDLYTKMKKYKLAAYHRIAAYKLLSLDSTTHPNNLAYNLVGMAELKIDINQLDSSLFYIDKALGTYPIDKNGIVKTEFLKDFFERKIYRYSIQKKISKNYFNLKELIEIDFITDALRKRQTDEASKADIRATAINFYKSAVPDCIDLNEEKQALYFKEKAKSILLIENYLQLTNEKEILDFKYAVDGLLKQKEVDSVSIARVFTKLKPILELIVKKYETNQSVNNEVFSDAIEKSMATNKPDHAYLDFFETENEMLVFQITNQIKVHRLPLNPQLADIVLQYKKEVANKDGDLRLAPIIYDAIIKPLGPLPKNLTIIPDSYLNHLPFETLHSGNHADPNDYSTYDFLIKKHNIDYNYSLGMASLMHDKKSKSHGKHVFLPTFTFPPTEEKKVYAAERQMLIPLLYAKEEAAGINKLFKTTFYQNMSANKTNFIHSLHTANIIHFAGHAIINPEDYHLSYLAFDSQEKDESRLYLKDIAGVSSTADLIVLSACQTASGKYAAGEGLLSLGRAIVSCGSKSVVTSMWNVYDYAGKDIITSFYQNLKAGSEKSIALHDAKLHFLHTLKSNKYGHPYYWSAFIFMGDNSPLAVEPDRYGYLFYLSIVTAGLALAFLGYKKFA